MIQENKKIDVIIPIYAPGDVLEKTLDMLQSQNYPINGIILLQTVEDNYDGELFSWTGKNSAGAGIKVDVVRINKSEFDHGATRRLGAKLSDADYIVFMTQDALPADNNLINELLKTFDNEKNAVSYARQLPAEGADVLEVLTRTYNYPEESRVKSAEDISKLGIKTYFCSDVCAMYDRKKYNAMGGFVDKTIFNEDMIMASVFINNGYNVTYCATAKVIHSHKYTCMQQYKRNFDLGVSQRQYKNVFESISSEKEGAGYAKNVIIYLLKHGKPFKAFYFCLQCAYKLFGYKKGLKYETMSKKAILKCTSNASYWK